MLKIMHTLLIFALLFMAGTAEARTLQLDDYLDWEEVADAQVSPDGERILYTRIRVDKFKDRRDSEVWQMDADGSRNRFLVKGGMPRWSPDGRRIAYIGEADGKAQLFVRWMDAEGAVSQVTHDQYAPNQFAWSPDGNWIAFRAQVKAGPSFAIELPARPEGAEWTADPPVFDRLHYRADRVGLKTGYNHLFVVPASGGAPRQLTEGEWDVGRRFSGLDVEGYGAFEWTPDGQYLLFAGDVGSTDEVVAFSSGLHRVAVASGEVTPLYSEPGSWGGVRISPDGRRIAFHGSPPTDKVWPAGQVRIMDSDGSNARVLLDALDEPFVSMSWDASGRGLYLNLGREGSVNVHHLGLNGELKQVTKGQQVVRLDSLSANTGIGTYTDSSITPNLARIDLRNGGTKLLTDVNADILAGVELGKVEEMWYESADGTRIQGWVVTPPGFDPSKKYPLILEIHGGPNAMYDVGFDFRFQEFVSHGYVLVYTNPRGSTGYGVEFTQAIDKQYPGRMDFEDLMAGVDAVIERGYIDTDRLYITGCSGGGALTTWVIGHTDRFAAAAPLCPVTDWISMAGTADIAGWANDQFDPPFWEDPTKWLEHSPLMHVGKVTTPTLLITGDQDLRTPLAQAEAYYAALKRRGVPTLLIPMVGEWHGTWSIPSNMLRTQLYLRKWFEQYGGSE